MAELKEEGENDLFDKLAKKGVITSEMKKNFMKCEDFETFWFTNMPQLITGLFTRQHATI